MEGGETLAGEGLLEEALTRFEGALALEPENPEAMEALGRVFLALDRPEEAEASFLDALEADPEWVAPRMGLAALAMRGDEPFKVVHHLERATVLDGEYPDAFVELGRYYGLMGEPGLARETFERWMRSHPDDAEMLLDAGLALFDAADYGGALDFFDRAIEAADETAGGREGPEVGAEQRNGARTFRANALDMLGRYEEAVAAYEEVISESPEWWEAHANLGICHARNGRTKEAEAAFRRGLKLCPGSPEIRDELAAHLLAHGGGAEAVREALALAEEAVALGRDEVRHLHTLAEARLAAGDAEGSAEAYRQVLELDPADPEAHLELGLYHERKGDPKGAEGHMVRAIKSDPENPRALYSYASLYYAAGELLAAEELLSRAVASDSQYAPALAALASVRARRGDRATSLDYLEKAVAAGERDAEHFRRAPEFAPLRDDPRFQRLLARMGGAS